MLRRDFITFLGGATAAWPMVARAQQSGAIKRLAILMDGSEASEGALLAAFREALERLGWSEGRNLQSTSRWGDGRADRARELGPELVKMNPDLVFVWGGTGLVALLQATPSIPIVFVFPGDPVATALVKSLARPGGNATGFTGYEATIAGKWLELLKEIAPSITRLLALHSGNLVASVALPVLEQAVGTVGVDMTSARASGAAEIELAIETAVQAPNLGMIVVPGSLTIAHRDLIVALAARHRVPTVYFNPSFVTAGGLVSYGVDPIELTRQAASYVDRIFRGEKPADLPVQAATKFRLVVNTKTAKALGLDVPTSILLRADQVIE